MGSNSRVSEKLDKDSRKRLEKLASHWKESPGEFSLSDLTLPDLRLLLEHFEPLQELLRHIAAPAQHTATTAEDKSSGAPQSVTLQAMEQLQTQLQQAQTELRQVQTELRQTQAELQQSQTQLQQTEVELQQAQAELHQAQTGLQQTRSEFNHLTSQCQAAQHDLAASNAAGQKLQQDNKTLKQTCKQLEKKLQQTQEQLTTCQAIQKQVPPELDLLRSDPDLARRLDLSSLPSDDSQALIQTVAVLAQPANLERLWSALKDRCEAENRSASMPERALLETALVWHNHNWRTRPYRLMEFTPPSAYHFENHLRSRQTPTGETVATLDLPGIADSSGAPLCKVLVRTR